MAYVSPVIGHYPRNPVFVIRRFPLPRRPPPPLHPLSTRFHSPVPPSSIRSGSSRLQSRKSHLHHLTLTPETRSKIGDRRNPRSPGKVRLGWLEENGQCWSFSRRPSPAGSVARFEAVVCTPFRQKHKQYDSRDLETILCLRDLIPLASAISGTVRETTTGT